MTAALLDDDLPEIGQSRPVWLMTLADLALLLVGFFVFVQASQQLDQNALAKGMREGFGVHDTGGQHPLERIEPIDPMAVSVGAMRGFAPGSAVPTQSGERLAAWARDATRDGRVSLRITGGVDGTPSDVDPATGSGAMLAADRARAVAMLLLAAHAVPADRLTIVTAPRPAGRAVTITTGFAGAGTKLPPGNALLPPRRIAR